jgi:capsid protein
VGIFSRIAGVIRGRFGNSQTVRIVHDRRDIRGTYDLAQTNSDNQSHWSVADAYDADSANSQSVRHITVKRSRYETGNNGFTKGITLTQANYVVGRGPKLRMQTGSNGMNAMVEAAWKRWAGRVKLARKLRTAEKAKVTDGEAFLLARDNPNGGDRVTLDLVGVETEQIASTDLLFAQKNRVDGIWFDDFGNPTFYDVLPRHPGGQWSLGLMKSEKVPAKFIFHLFREDRPGQHRAIPELSSTLSAGGQSRRWREAVLSSAELLSKVPYFLKTQADPMIGPGQVLPFDTLEVQNGVIVGLPSGGDVFQAKAEQPPTTHESFLRTQVGEQARPLSMSYSLAACDSSNANFASAKLDQHPYFAAVDVDQADIEDSVLDPLFALWFEQATTVYGWNFDGASAPSHAWDWPGVPIVNEVDTATSRKTNISTGVSNVPRIVAEDGYDAEEELEKEAAYYGVTVDDMRAKHFQSDFQQAGGTPANQSNGSPQPGDGQPAKSNGVNRIARNGSNGHARSVA